MPIRPPKRVLSIDGTGFEQPRLVPNAIVPGMTTLPPTSSSHPVGHPPVFRAWTALPIIALFFWLDHFHLDLFRLIASDWTGKRRLVALAVLGYGPQWLVALGVAALLVGPRRAAGALGLHGRPLRALTLGVLLTLPMLLGLAWSAPLVLTPETPQALWRMAVLPGLGEELLYRSFLFGLLFRFAGWGFLPAALVAALLFGGAHLYQGGAAGEAAGIFALTALGSLWFAWLYIEWDFDLWMPVAFHVLMNAWWILFPVADNALGPAWTIALRLTVLALSVVVTAALARRRGGLHLRGRAWWWQHTPG